MVVILVISPLRKNALQGSIMPCRPPQCPAEGGQVFRHVNAPCVAQAFWLQTAVVRRSSRVAAAETKTHPQSLTRKPRTQKPQTALKPETLTIAPEPRNPEPRNPACTSVRVETPKPRNPKLPSAETLNPQHPENLKSASLETLKPVTHLNCRSAMASGFGSLYFDAVYWPALCPTVGSPLCVPPQRFEQL